MPFEKELFSKTPLQVAYVGHPLVHRLKTYMYKTPSFSSGREVIALFPGSRRKEIERNLPLYLDVCRELQKKRPDLQICLSVSEERYRQLILKILNERGWEEGEGIALIASENSYELMKAALFAIAKSGTVTLELAMHRVPTIVTYGVSFLDKIIAYDILRIRLPFYCIVNIIMKREVFGELIGPHLTLEKLIAKAEELLEETVRAQIQHDCDLLIAQLGEKQTSEKAADEILQLKN